MFTLQCSFPSVDSLFTFVLNSIPYVVQWIPKIIYPHTVYTRHRCSYYSTWLIGCSLALQLIQCNIEVRWCRSGDCGAGTGGREERQLSLPAPLPRGQRGQYCPLHSSAIVAEQNSCSVTCKCVYLCISVSQYTEDNSSFTSIVTIVRSYSSMKSLSWTFQCRKN